MFVISDEILEQAKMTEKELRQEIAVVLYSQNKLSFGQAKKLAGLNHFEFQKLLDEHGISINYGVQDFNNDIQALKKMNRI